MKTGQTETMLKYLLDIDRRSVMNTYTPGRDADRLPVSLEQFGCFYAESSYFTERSGLDSWLLMYTFGGQGLVRTLNGETVAGPGSIVLIDCMEYQYYRTISCDSWNFKWFHFKGPLAGQYGEAITRDGLCVLNGPGTERAGAMIGELFECASRKSSYTDLLISGKIIEILNMIATERIGMTDKYSDRRCVSCIENAVGLIHSSFPERLSLEQMAEHAHLSKYHFLRLFRAETGLTPHEYVISHSVNMSKKMLWQTSATVADIASECGFSDSNSYIRAFKKLCGVTPNAYRKERAFPL